MEQLIDDGPVGEFVKRGSAAVNRSRAMRGVGGVPLLTRVIATRCRSVVPIRNPQAMASGVPRSSSCTSPLLSTGSCAPRGCDARRHVVSTGAVS